MAPENTRREAGPIQKMDRRGFLQLQRAENLQLQAAGLPGAAAR